MIEKGTVLTSAAIVLNDKHGVLQWLVVKQKEDGDWEIPKFIVRRGESSVRTAIRVMGEKGGMSLRVLEEAGRISWISNCDGKTISHKCLYYIMKLKTPPKEIFGFPESVWLDSSKALSKIVSKKEKEIFKKARDLYKEIKIKDKKKRQA
jgi:hypothetical protein